MTSSRSVSASAALWFVSSVTPSSTEPLSGATFEKTRPVWMFRRYAVQPSRPSGRAISKVGTMGLDPSSAEIGSKLLMAKAWSGGYGLISGGKTGTYGEYGSSVRS